MHPASRDGGAGGFLQMHSPVAVHLPALSARLLPDPEDDAAHPHGDVGGSGVGMTSAWAGATYGP